MNDATRPNPREIGTLVALVNNDRLREAEHEARTLLTMHPDEGMLWKILSVALLRQRKDALPALRRATELLPDDGEAHGNLGAALHDQGQWTAALGSLQRALQIRPHDPEALVAAANALKALGRTREAVPLYQRALELRPRLTEAHNNLGNAFLQLGQCADAITYYRSALRIKPDDAQVLCNLGNALRQLGRLDEAVASTRRAIVVDPTLSVAHNNLGLILAALGSRDAAIASYRQALLLNPSYVDALNNLGSGLRQAGARREAVSLYGRAIELEPGHAESHLNLGDVLSELGRIDAAVEVYRLAARLQPYHTATHVSLATALRQQHRGSDAEASCHAALAIDPNSVEALCLLGELRADRGCFLEAEHLFQRSIVINPDFPSAFFGIAKQRKMTGEDTAWLKGAEALLAKPVPLGHEITLHYALGKYFDDVGQYNHAFQHYERANDLTNRHASPHNRAQLTQRIDELIRCFDAGFVRRCASHASGSELPVFIIGMPRSGTSLTEQILASHPDVFGAGELAFWDAASREYRETKPDDEDGANLATAIARDYLNRLTALSGGTRRVVDKLPANFMYAGLIHAVFPRARIIHMQRHQLDTCLSIYFQNFPDMGRYASDLDNLAHYYREYVRITDHWRATLPATALLEIPYEALIDDQEGWTRRMLEFIGLPWDPACRDFHLTERVVITASKWQVRQPIHAGSVGRWKNYAEFLGPLRSLAALSPP